MGKAAKGKPIMIVKEINLVESQWQNAVIGRGDLKEGCRRRKKHFLESMCLKQGGRK